MRPVFRSLALLSAISLAACSRATPEAAASGTTASDAVASEAVTSGVSASGAASATVGAAPSASELPDCMDWDFIAQSGNAQWNALRSRPGLRCERIGPPGSEFIECTPDADDRLHGLTVSSLIVNHPMGADQLQADLAGDAQTAVRRFREILGRAPDIVDPTDAGWIWVDRHKDGRERRVQVYAGGQAPPQLTCSIADASAPIADSDAAAPAYGVALVRALTRCEAVEFMQRDRDARRQALLAAGLDCAPRRSGSEAALACSLPAGARSWGDVSAEALLIVDRDGLRLGIVRAAANPKRFRAAIERELGMPMNVDRNGEAYTDAGLDDMYRMRLIARGDGKTDLHCQYPIPADEQAKPTPDQDRAAHAGGPFPADTAAQDQPPAGAIQGTIMYPDGNAPALRICALQGDGPIRRCVETAAGAKTYQIERVPAGSYVVIAQARQGALRTGGHVQQVQCIRAPCPEMPAEVFVPGGGGVSGIDLNGFYDAREDFPALPSP